VTGEGHIAQSPPGKAVPGIWPTARCNIFAESPWMTTAFRPKRATCISPITPPSIKGRDSSFGLTLSNKLFK
jgi:hypothetical protein